jgi:two-component system phosphate regulon sensor histidine kinase PhoR
LAIYRAPLREGDQIFVTVEVGIPKGSFWHKIASASEHGLLFILIGLVACGVGSSFLWMVLKPLASIERQLRAAATDNVAEMPLQTVPATSLAAIGWNRMLDEMTRRTSGGNLQERVATGLRSHREKRAEAILKSLTDGVALTDHEDRITFVNSALLGILNLTDDALLGRTMDEFFQFAAGAGPSRKFLDSQFRAQQVIAEVGRNGDMAAGVLRIARVPLVTQGQEGALNHVWMIRDVTQQKLADQMRNQFVYSATHELRTPLANIKAYAETLAETRFSDIEKQKQFCNTINVEATRLSRFIDDLLSISRMETGAMSLQKYETDVARLLDEVVDKVRPEMDAKRIAFNTLLPPKLPKLMLDKDKINVTLVNLLGNAAKYTPEGGNVSLEVEWANDLLQIHVVDSGIGIAQQDLAKVFDKFYRSNDPRVQDRTGSGLGLSIAQEIVRLHGGKIAVHSELDKGSKFTVVLPTR